MTIDRPSRSCGTRRAGLARAIGRAGSGPFYVKVGFREVGRVSCRNVPLIYFELLV